MQLGMIGLGRMGGNMVQRLLQGGHELVVFDRSSDVVKQHADAMLAHEDKLPPATQARINGALTGGRNVTVRATSAHADTTAAKTGGGRRSPP